MKTLRRTRAICTQCFKPVPADMCLTADDRIVLRKECVADGQTIDEVTGHGWFFAELDRFYQNIMKRMTQQGYFLEISSTCNLDCKFCYLKDKDPEAIPDLPIDDIPREHLKGKIIDVIGAEPTLAPNLLEKIRRIRELGGRVELSTNGVRCKDEGFVRQLKDAGVERVLVQFDSLDDRYYVEHVHMPLVQTKLKAIENLNKAELPVTLRMVIIRGWNDEEMWPMLDFLQRHPYTVSIHFMGLSKLGMALENYHGDSLMPLDMIHAFCAQSGGLVDMRDVLVFLKSFYTWTAIQEVKWCMHIYPFLLLRDGDTYLTYRAIFDRDVLERELDRLNATFDTKRRKSNWPRYVLAHLRALKWKDLFRHGVRQRRLLWVWLRGGVKALVREFSEVNFFTICYPDMIDFNIINNCVRGSITSHESVPMVMENCAHTAYLREKYYKERGGSAGPTYMPGSRDEDGGHTKLLQIVPSVRLSIANAVDDNRAGQVGTRAGMGG